MNAFKDIINRINKLEKDQKETVDLMLKRQYIPQKEFRRLEKFEKDLSELKERTTALETYKKQLRAFDSFEVLTDVLRELLTIYQPDLLDKLGGDISEEKWNELKKREKEGYPEWNRVILDKAQPSEHAPNYIPGIGHVSVIDDEEEFIHGTTYRKLVKEFIEDLNSNNTYVLNQRISKNNRLIEKWEKYLNLTSS